MFVYMYRLPDYYEEEEEEEKKKDTCYLEMLFFFLCKCTVFSLLLLVKHPREFNLLQYIFIICSPPM